MTDEQKALNAQTLVQMKNISHLFYTMATQLDSHQFVELTGFMNEFIKACERAHKADIDFVTERVPFKPYEMEYLAEKIDCMFGRELQDLELRKAFLRALAQKGEWSLYETAIAATR